MDKSIAQGIQYIYMLTDGNYMHEGKHLVNAQHNQI